MANPVATQTPLGAGADVASEEGAELARDFSKNVATRKAAERAALLRTGAKLVPGLGAIVTAYEVRPYVGGMVEKGVEWYYTEQRNDDLRALIECQQERNRKRAKRKGKPGKIQAFGGDYSNFGPSRLGKVQTASKGKKAEPEAAAAAPPAGGGGRGRDRIDPPETYYRYDPATGEFVLCYKGTSSPVSGAARIPGHRSHEIPSEKLGPRLSSGDTYQGGK